jgi:Family of unknown function (DUF6188)
LDGAELLQVAVRENEVTLNFTSDISITITSAIRLDGHGATSYVIEGPREAAAALLDLLGGTLVAARGTADGTLTLTWSDERHLAIFDSWPSYESYTIAYAGGVIVV